MSARFTRRDVLRGSLGACACLGLDRRAAAQLLHTPENALDRWYRGLCGLCGLADPLFLGAAGGRLRAVKGDALSPVGRGRLCTRGMALPATLDPDRRPETPLLRRDPSTKGSDGGLEPVGWDEAWAWIADRLGGELRADASRVAAFLDHGLPCETQLVAQRLLRGHLGCATVESNLRLDGVAGLAALERGTGVAGPVGYLGDADGADLFLVVGADPAERQPTLFARMALCQRRSGTPTVLIDPRRTLTTGLADVFVRPRRPATDAPLLRAMAHVVLRDGAADDRAAALPGYAALVERARAWSPLRAAEVSGARVEDIEAAATAFLDSASTFTLVGRGLMRQGRDAVAALVDLHLLTGRLDQGSTILPLLDGPNALGAWLMGCLADRLPGGRRLDDAGHRAELASLWGTAAERMPATAGLPLGDWLAALEDGRLTAVVDLGCNLLPLLPANTRWRAALARATFVLASPVHPTESSAWADLVLPMAVPWLEEPGTHVNAERRVQRTAPPPPSENRRSSLDLCVGLAEALLSETEFTAGFAPYRRLGAELAWEHARAATAGRPCDLSGMDYAALADAQATNSFRGLLWPHPDGADVGDATSPASAYLRPSAPSFSAVSFESHGPTGDNALDLVVFATSQHHGARELTGYAPELHHASPRAWIEMNSRDARDAGLRDGDWAALESDTGLLVARVWLTDRVRAGLVAIPEHFGFCCDREGGTDGRAEPESLAAAVLPMATDPACGQIAATARVRVRKPTDDEMSARALRKS